VTGVRKILVLGASGQVGIELQRSFAGFGEIIAADRDRVDLSIPDQIRDAVRRARPDVILNAAAYTAVDRAESEPELAMAINGHAPGILAEEARRHDSILVHYSTDYVFDGTKEEPWTEADPTHPLNVYGASKLASDKLFVAGNSYSGGNKTRFAVVRYGNVMGSRGSVIPFFLSLAKQGVLPVTDERMTRFMITLEQAVELVWRALDDMVGGEIYVKKIPSMNITQIADAVAPGARREIVGIRPGEKLHEQMIGIEDAAHTYDYAGYYKILPAIHQWSDDPARISGGAKVASDFNYRSDNNPDWMSVQTLKEWIELNREKIGKY